MHQEDNDRHSFIPSFMRRKKRSSSIDLGSPVEVRPGIWSNDPTAKVFGLDKLALPPPEYPKNNQRSKSLRVPASSRNNQKQGRSLSHSGKNSQVSPSLHSHRREDSLQERWQSYKRIHGNGDFTDTAKLYRTFIREGGTRSRMRDSEDYITQRAPNPWTGVITPSVYSDEGRITGFNAAPIGSDLQRQQSTRWKRSANSWFTKPLTPVAQSEATSPRLPAPAPPSSQSAGDRFVVNMPSAHDPSPFDQEKVGEWERRRRAASSNGATDPFEPPTPPPKSPDVNGPVPKVMGCMNDSRTPSLPRIRRKPVGSQSAEPRASEDTVVIKRRSSPAMRAQSGVAPRISITTPKLTTRNLSSLSDKEPPQPQSFLDLPPQDRIALRMNRDSPFPFIGSQRETPSSGEAHRPSISPKYLDQHPRACEYQRMEHHHLLTHHKTPLHLREPLNQKSNLQGHHHPQQRLELPRFITTTPTNTLPWHRHLDGAGDHLPAVTANATGAHPCPALTNPAMTLRQTEVEAIPPQTEFESFRAVSAKPQLTRFSNFMPLPRCLTKTAERGADNTQGTRTPMIAEETISTPMSTSTCQYLPSNPNHAGRSGELSNILAALATLPDNEAECLCKRKVDIAKEYISTRYHDRLSITQTSILHDTTRHSFPSNAVVILYGMVFLFCLITVRDWVLFFHRCWRAAVLSYQTLGLNA
ncbi:MAG: hypothetical protein M1814_001649 [Vezdaea aestivalis]|nr:MAG: hypothetical protein M1814_001649 [Vezdaea aestivalis]